MYDYACESAIVNTNLARNFTMKGIEKEILKNHVSKIPFKDYGYTKMILSRIYSGWRPQELASIETEHVDIIFYYEQ